jgi:hypothetical protein
LITSPHLALGVLLQSGDGKGFGVVRLGRHAPARADASPFLDEQDAAGASAIRPTPDTIATPINPDTRDTGPVPIRAIGAGELGAMQALRS